MMMADTGSGSITARAIRAESDGGAEVLAVADVELPPLNPGEARVRVTLAGVNYWDVMQRVGQVPLPSTRIPGVEGVGHVVAVGDPADEALVGTRVAWSKVQGSYAEFVQGDAGWFIPVPEGLADEVAAAVLMQGVTAGYLLEATPRLEAGAVALVFAAAGGVGTLLTQLLKARGVRVCGVVSRDEKRQTALEAGAEQVLVDGDDLVERFRTFCPDGAAAVYDGNGGPQLVRAFDLLGDRGALIVFGTAAGPLPSVDLGALGRGSFTVTRVAGKHFAGDIRSWAPQAAAIFEQARAGALTPIVDRVLPMDQAGSLHQLLESRKNRGKMLLQVARSTATTG